MADATPAADPHHLTIINEAARHRERHYGKPFAALFTDILLASPHLLVAIHQLEYALSGAMLHNARNTIVSRLSK